MDFPVCSSSERTMSVLAPFRRGNEKNRRFTYLILPLQNRRGLPPKSFRFTFLPERFQNRYAVLHNPSVSFAASSLYTREPLGVRHPPAFHSSAHGTITTLSFNPPRSGTLYNLSYLICKHARLLDGSGRFFTDAARTWQTGNTQAKTGRPRWWR